ncbi:MAG TPA: MarR family transcriptional regulator [Candidatus Deferrimicrobium sp.]|nr:MarR family transcriptional regulator [Candidatus Deferrimicrobium sp.]
MNNKNDESLHLNYIMELTGFFHRLIRVISGSARESKTNEIRYYILKTLEQKGKQNLTEISDTLFFKKNALSQLLDRMVNDRLIERNADADDRRKIILCLTTHGQEVLKEYEKKCIENFKKYAFTLPDNEKKEFIDALEVLVSLIRKNRQEFDNYFARYSLTSEDK